MRFFEIEDFRKVPIENFVPKDEDLDDLKSKFLPDWEMLDHQYLTAKYVAKDHRHALEFLKFINKLSEKMDHFTEVTQDVAEVKVRTSTFDVKGLTILDFKIALYIDRYAEKNDIEQVRMSGNFGMHENLKKWFKEKWVRFGPDGKIRGQCAREKSSEGKPKCLPQSKAHSLGKKGRATAASRKRREDPNPERKGSAKNVRTK
jgi:pterin-4a-carbinolamine dehydratase